MIKIPKILVLLALWGFAGSRGLRCQVFFGPEIPVTINSLTFDAMEPALSADGNVLFFNSLNDGITTSLFYANRVNDSVFNYGGPLTGANQSVTPRLDAVASSDSAGNFYWTSLRDFPAQQENCFYGKFNGSNVVNIGRLKGDLYKNSAGWLMMDGCVDYSGKYFYFTNAYFGPTFNNCGGVPCKTEMGLAQKLNDSTFNRVALSDSLLKVLNDTNYATYAPHISRNGLELYYTRFLRSNLAQGTQNCVSLRSNSAQPFGPPLVLHPFSVMVPEAACLSTEGNRMYFHRKTEGLFKLFLRYRQDLTGSGEQYTDEIRLFPNPSAGSFEVNSPEAADLRIEIYSLQGHLLLQTRDRLVRLAEYKDGVYMVKLRHENSSTWRKIILIKN